MRPLAAFVIAETVVLCSLLYAVFGGGAAAGAATAPSPAPTAPPTTNASRAGAAAPTLPTPPSTLERTTAAAAEAPPVTAGIVVHGTVRDEEGQPVGGVQVYWRREDIWRSGNGASPGAYAVAGMTPGHWEVTCQAEGFVEAPFSREVGSRAEQHVDLTLRRAHVVRVKVLDAAGTDVLADLAKGSASQLPTVIATRTPLARELPPTDQTRLTRFGLGRWRGSDDLAGRRGATLPADLAGELLLDEPPPLFASLVLRTKVLQVQRIEPGQHELVFTIERDALLAGFGALTVRLLDSTTGEPLPDVRVSIGTAQGGGTGGKSDARGRTTIERVLPGLGHLSIEGGRDRESIRRFVRIQAGQTTDLGDLLLHPAAELAGVVVDAAGNPVNGASVQWTDLDGRTFPLPLVTNMSTLCDDEGRFRIGRCGRHRFVVTAETTEGARGHALVDTRSGFPAALRIPVAPTTRVALRSTFTGVGYTVSVLTAERTPVHVVMLGAEYRPTSLQLPPGDYTVEIHEMDSDVLVRSAPLHVGSAPTEIVVP